MATLDATTQAEYAAEINAADRAQVIIDALTAPVYVKIYNDADEVAGSGTMSEPWATVVDDTLVPSTLNGLFATLSGVPDTNWHLKFESGARYVQLTFGASGSDKEAVWSLSDFTEGTRAGISPSVITVTGNRPPAWAGAPSALSLADGATQSFAAYASDPDEDQLTFSLSSGGTNGYSITAAGVLTVGTVSQSVTVRVTDQNGLTADHVCAVTVAAAGASETPDYADPVAGVTLESGRTTVNVSTTAALQTAINNAVAKTTIQLAAGTYAGTVTLNKSFAASQALIIKGAANFASIATGTWLFTGARQIVTGIDFNGTGAKCSVQGENNKLVGNKFRGWTTAGVITTSGSTGYPDIEVAYNEIGPPGSPAGVTYRWGIKAFSDSAESSVSKRMWIHHNWFRDYNAGYQGVNTRGDAIEAGESGTVPYALTLVAGWYIEDNVVTNAQMGGDALFDVKYGGCVIRRNTVDAASSNCKVQSRQGTSSIFEANYLGNGTIETSGRGHKIAGNRGTVRLLAGEDEYTAFSNLHHRSYQVLTAKNTGTLTVGYQYDSGYALPALETTIEEHTGTITLALHSGTVDNRGSPSSYQCETAVQKTSADAGPVAITNASAAYKAARGL